MITTEPSLSASLPLSNVQRELLTLFAQNIPERHLQELKSVIARFLMERAIEEASAVWDERGYSDEQLIAEARSGMTRAEMVRHQAS